MKDYVSPELQLILLSSKSILTESGDSNIVDGGANTDEGWGKLIPIKL